MFHVEAGLVREIEPIADQDVLAILDVTKILMRADDPTQYIGSTVPALGERAAARLILFKSYWLTATYYERKRAILKTMTCKHLGGPCDFKLHGSTADEIIKAEDKHLKEMVASGDDTHKSAFEEMKARWKHPVSGLRWYKKTKRDFAALPED